MAKEKQTYTNLILKYVFTRGFLVPSLDTFRLTICLVCDNKKAGFINEQTGERILVGSEMGPQNVASVARPVYQLKVPCDHNTELLSSHSHSESTYKSVKPLPCPQIQFSSCTVLAQKSNFK